MVSRIDQPQEPFLPGLCRRALESLCNERLGAPDRKSQRLAACQPRGDCSGEGTAGSVHHPHLHPSPGKPGSLLGSEKEIVGRTVGVPSLHQHGTGPRFQKDARRPLRVVLVGELARLDAVGGHEGATRDHALDQIPPAPPFEEERPVARAQDRVDHAWDGKPIEDHAHAQDDIVGREHPDLDGVGSEFLERDVELVGDDGGEGRVDRVDPACALRGERRRHRHPVNAVMREDLQIHLDPRAPGGVGSGDRQGRRQGPGLLHRLNRLAQAGLAICLLLLATATARAGSPTVLVLSWDGVKPGYIDRAPTPGLDRLRREGTEAERLVPVFPSSTFPVHVSLATGTFTDRHGIVGNVFRDRERGLFRYSNDASWIEAEPIWAAAERQGVRAAVFFWVGSETDWRGTGATYRRAPFDGSVPESEKVDQILAWIDLPESERPRLILSWWHGCDEVGHRGGPDGRRIAGQLASQDRELVRLLDGLDARDAWDDTTLLIVSDHGMAAVNEPIELRKTLQEGGVQADIINGGGMARVYLRHERDRAKALELLSAVPGVKAYAAESLPGRLRAYHPRRAGDIVVLTEPPRVFGRPSRSERMLGPIARRFGLSRGAHGFDPELPEMGAIFMAIGRGVPVGEQIGPQRAVDVAPTIARLLGIDPPSHAEGRPIRGLGPGSEAERLR